MNQDEDQHPNVDNINRNKESNFIRLKLDNTRGYFNEVCDSSLLSSEDIEEEDQGSHRITINRDGRHEDVHEVRDYVSFNTPIN
jgi:hypothetical protein